MHGRVSTARELLLLALEYPAHTPSRLFCPLGALQDLSSTEQVLAILYGLEAGQLWWKRSTLPQARGVHPQSFLLRERCKGVQAALLTLGHNDPKETWLLVAISKHTSSKPALCKKEGPQDNRLPHL